MAKPSSKNQPKILQKRSTRTLIYVLVIGAAFGGVRWYVDNQNDPANVGNANTIDMVAAVEQLDNGQKLVAFDATGKKIETGGYEDGAIDRDLAWQPDGNRLFFVSNRGGKAFQVYRWKPGAGNEPEARSLGSSGKSDPTFPTADVPDANTSVLIVSSGYVLELDPKDVMKSHQVLPPSVGEIPTEDNGAEGGGQTGQFSMIYQALGESFRTARWCAGKSAVAAVMRREQGGETLIVQPLPENGQVPRPISLMVADHIDFDVNPTDGSIVFAAQGIHLPESELRKIKEAKVPVRVTRHAVGLYKPGDKAPKVVLTSADDKVSFSGPTVSPQGDRFLLMLGEFDKTAGSVRASRLVTYPFSTDIAEAGSVLVEGEVAQPSWSPSGERIALVKRTPGGKRAIFTMKNDGTEEKNLSGEAGDFAEPHFSPQTK